MVAAFWALLTLSYSTHVLARWAWHDQSPGLSALVRGGAVPVIPAVTSFALTLVFRHLLTAREARGAPET